MAKKLRQQLYQVLWGFLQLKKLYRKKKYYTANNIKAIAVIHERILKNFLKRSKLERKRANTKIIAPTINIT